MTKIKIEQRLQNMKKFYVKAGEMIDNFSNAFPEKTRTMLKDNILGATETSFWRKKCAKVCVTKKSNYYQWEILWV